MKPKSTLRSYLSLAGGSLLAMPMACAANGNHDYTSSGAEILNGSNGLTGKGFIRAKAISP